MIPPVSHPVRVSLERFLSTQANRHGKHLTFANASMRR